MERTHGAALALAGLLVLAGCVGGPPGSVAAGDGDASAGDATERAATTAEPAASQDGPANESNVTDDRVDLPPGVSLDGVTNASALVAAHERALAESGFSFVLRTNLSSGFAGGVEQWAVQNGSVAAGLSPFQLQTVTRVLFENRSASPPATTTDAWGNDSTVVVRNRRENVTQVQQFDRSLAGPARVQPGGRSPAAGPGAGTPASFDELLTQTVVVRSVLQSGEFEVANVRQEGNLTLVTLSATGLDEASFGPTGNVSAFEATLVVDEDGRVRELDYTLAFADGQGPAVRYRYRLTDVGDVRVGQPAWVTSSFDPVSASIEMETVEDRAIRLANDGEGSLPAGSTVELTHAGESVRFSLDSALRPGQALFLYVAPDGTPRLSAGRPPADARGLDGSYGIVVRTPAGQVLFQGQLSIQRSG